MKKKYLFFSLLFILSLFLGYRYIHFYNAASCLEPATCIICHKTKGEALGHDYLPATCTDPEICQRCEAIGQSALGHDFDYLTSTYHICNRCLKEEGHIENCLEEGNFLVYNLNYDKLLFANNESEHLACASLTKLVTIPLALKYLDLDENITISTEVNLIKPHSSIAGLVQNDILTVSQLVDACLICSDNDAAYVLAYHAALKVNPDLTQDKAISFFVSLMNDYVKDLGCLNSFFCSPDGLDYDTQYTTCLDLIKIAQAALKIDIIRESCQKKSSRVVSKKGLVYFFNNTNKLMNIDSIYYDKNVIGLKTGTTSFAGNCIIALLDNDDLEYLIISLNNKTDEDRYKQVKSLLAYIY